MYCFDTNIIIDLLRGDREVIKKVSMISDGNSDIFITPVTLCELFRGAYAHAKPEEKIVLVKSFTSNYEVLDFDSESSEEFGKTYVMLQRTGKSISDFDLMIASIVKANDLILVTRDKKHFIDTGVKLEVW